MTFWIVMLSSASRIFLPIPSWPPGCVSRVSRSLRAPPRGTPVRSA